LKIQTERACDKCQLKVLNTTSSSFIGLTIEKSWKQKKFSQLFRQSSCIIQCTNCNCVSQTTNDTYKLNADTNFISVYINSSYFSAGAGKRAQCKIINFDPLNVQIPGIVDCSFKVKSAICHDTSSSNDIANGGGHYIIWSISKCNSGWMRISDTFGRYYNTLIKDLKDVIFLVLEKNV
jgi:hypothetical protein